MDDNSKPDLSAIVEQVDFSDLFVDSSVETEQVNFWLPKPYKQEFNALQSETKREFGKRIKQVIMLCIDHAKAERSKAS